MEDFVMPESAQHQLVKALEEELEKDQAMSAKLGRAMELAKEYGVSAYDLTLCFAEACFRKCINVAQDAWFEHGFRYAEIEFDGLRCEWGKL